MNADACKLSEDELEMEQFRFVFIPDSLQLRCVRREIFRRNCEFSQWTSYGFWKFPDLHKESTLPETDPPEWAKQDAVAFISNQLSFQL